mgnify:CR=1 FL=1
MSELIRNMGMGFSTIAGVTPVLLILLGVCVGILGGAIPGISPSMAVALLLPITYTMSPAMAMVMLMGIYIGANYGGSITAIAINTPGTPSATVTSFDGYPLNKQGRAGEAMGISLWASVIGGVISIFILIFFSVPLSKVALKFWPSEYFALCFMGLTTVSTLGGKNWKKALAAVIFGLFASMFVANALMALVGTYGSKIWVRVGDLPKTLLYPLIFAFSILGSYSISKSLFDVGTCLVFGLIGWMFKKYDYPASPVVLGLVLGRLMELNFGQALMVSGISSFVTRPMTVILFIISIAAIVSPILAEKKAANKRTAAN